MNPNILMPAFKILTTNMDCLESFWNVQSQMPPLLSAALGVCNPFIHSSRCYCMISK